jgi:hypothetical protein
MNRKLFIGLFLLIISVIMFYTFSEYADWYVKHTNMLIAGTLIVIAILFSEFAIILLCDYFNHRHKR